MNLEAVSALVGLHIVHSGQEIIWMYMFLMRSADAVYVGPATCYPYFLVYDIEKVQNCKGRVLEFFDEWPEIRHFMQKRIGLERLSRSQIQGLRAPLLQQTDQLPVQAVALGSIDAETPNQRREKNFC